MNTTRRLALPAAGAAALLLSAGAHGAAPRARTAIAPVSPGVPVYVRVEGLGRELLPSTKVILKPGLVTRNGGACGNQTAAGALDLATRGRWVGRYYASYKDFLVSAILGEAYTAKANHYWGFYAGGALAPAGICSTNARAGAHFVFAAVPTSGRSLKLLDLTGPVRVTRGRTIHLKVVGYDAKGAPSALARATVRGGGRSFASNAAGVVAFSSARAGRFELTATKRGYVRSVLGVTVLK